MLKKSLPAKYKRLATTGDCGVYAIAQAERWVQNGATVQIGIAVDENYEVLPTITELGEGEPNVKHIVIRNGDKMYDVEGEITVEALQDNYFDGGALAILFYDLSPELERFVRCNTNYSNEIDTWRYTLKQLQS